MAVFDFAADSARVLVENSAGAWYSPTGHLLYTDRAGGLYAAGFDPQRLQLARPGGTVTENVVQDHAGAVGDGNRTLFGGGRSAETIRAEVGFARWHLLAPRLHMARGVATTPRSPPTAGPLPSACVTGRPNCGSGEPTAPGRSFTQDGTVNWRPSWSPDGQSIVFASNKRGGGSADAFDIYRMPVDGSAPPAPLVDHTFGLSVELSRDGQWLVVRADEVEGSANIRARRLAGDSTLLPLVVDKYASLQVALSPDGRWLAYTSDATGRFEVYVAPFPGMSSTASSRPAVAPNRAGRGTGRNCSTREWVG